MTKVTYYMYSFDTCCMSREIMEMDSRDSTKCQNPRFKDMDEEKDIRVNSVIFFFKRPKGEGEEKILQWLGF